MIFLDVILIFKKPQVIETTKSKILNAVTADTEHIDCLVDLVEVIIGRVATVSQTVPRYRYFLTNSPPKRNSDSTGP